MDKNIQYLNKDFSSLKSKLIEFAKSYYPNTYNDFSEASPGMMLIEMISYVGDILSFYQENQIQENFLQFSKQRKNLLAQSYLYGYIPKITTVSNVIMDIYQLIPAINISGSITPDFNYALILQEGTKLKSNQNNKLDFIIEDKIDFSFSSSFDNTEVSVYSLDINQEPDFYLLKKQKKAYSATEKQLTVNIESPQRFKTIQINDNNIIKILEIKDSDNNIWYEVPYLAQDTIYEKSKINNDNRYNLSLFKTSRRFVTRFKTNNILEIQFGAGGGNLIDEEIIPNFDNVGLGLPYGVNKLTTAYDPTNFLYSNTYGVSPSNTILTIKYLVGGGIESNTNSNTITTLSESDTSFKGDVDLLLSQTILSSLSFNNEFASVGGGNGDDDETLKLKILSNFPTQLRAITLNDYIIRSLSLPSEYGIVSKVFITKDTIDSNLISIYILSSDNNNKLTKADDILKTNLQTYLGEYKTLTDSVIIKDAYIINIGIDFDIVIRPNYNNKITISKCIEALLLYFKNIEINKPIILPDLYTLLDQVEGVQTVKHIEIVNKFGEINGYSKYSYDMKSATRNNIIYPSLNPSIFELKYNTDIQGRSVSF